MKYISKELNEWVIRKIKKDYPDDIALLVGHEHWKIAPDGDEIAFNFFVPSTDRGRNLSQTFIIDEIGYDLFPISWDRLEGIASINERLTTILADGVILYAKNEEDKKHFINLQKQLQDNLNNKEFAYKKGLEKINIAMELFQNMLFEKSLSSVRKACGYIAQYLSEAIAAVNGTYFKKGAENQIKALGELSEVPDGFTCLYEKIISSETIEDLKDICYQMLSLARDFFSSRKIENEIKMKNHNFEDLADWYQECTYWFRRIYYYCDVNEAVNCFTQGCSLQCELDYLTEEFGIDTMELMNTFNSGDLNAFSNRTKKIEEYIISEIKKHGVKIQSFKNLDEFLKINS